MKPNPSDAGGLPASPRVSRRGALLGALGAGLAAAADAWLIEPSWIEVERLDVPIAGLGGAWHGATVALLSDTHCGRFTAPSFIERAVALASALEPDVVLLLGDYVHRGARFIGPGVAPFGGLRAREGVFAVLGNHDHWDGRDAAYAALRRANVDALVNGSVVLRRRGDPLAIGGVGDLMEDEQDLERAFQGCPQATPRLLMQHNPDYAEAMAPSVRVDLMVCGHTHGGQVHVPFVGAPILPSRYGKKYQQGLVEGPRCRVYVTRGIGTISPPVRIGCRPEVTLLRLVAA